MRRNSSLRKKSGVALLLVIVCLIIVTTMIGAMLRHLMLANRQVKQRSNQIQATWLAESGVERAVFAILHDPNYSAEVWQLTPKELDGASPGRVEIRVDTEAENASFAVINVLATYPYGSKYTVKARKRVTVSQPQLGLGRNNNDAESDQDATP